MPHSCSGLRNINWRHLKRHSATEIAVNCSIIAQTASIFDYLKPPKYLHKDAQKLEKILQTFAKKYVYNELMATGSDEVSKSVHVPWL